jgi:hypothetical protein
MTRQSTWLMKTAGAPPEIVKLKLGGNRNRFTMC